MTTYRTTLIKKIHGFSDDPSSSITNMYEYDAMVFLIEQLDSGKLEDWTIRRSIDGYYLESKSLTDCGIRVWDDKGYMFSIAFFIRWLKFNEMEKLKTMYEGLCED